MNPELDIYGVFVPTVAMLGLVAYVISVLVRRLLDRVGFYTLVWHRPLFDMAILVCILAGLVETADKVIL
ncbi:DUF1656 domain-containing protein (plasmid) [Aliirhizobium terrae]|uniref:DUF1656 domain-containing protein n=1 Tax=Terrirhizobium terrae TaxID=2926709 RepID=UPI002577E926|nr:DUF1656 domain-containing protein [Rhizobium sp. CC-CFT758]WJH37634.1 DUF1656 domain-containing protein [Rhizobium sp. CC-CFT758]